MAGVEWSFWWGPLPLLFGLEAASVQGVDLTTGDAEDLTQGRVCRVGGVVGRVHQPAPLELDQVVYLLLGEVFHGKI